MDMAGAFTNGGACCLMRKYALNLTKFCI